MSTTECCGWTGWAAMAGIGPDGRPLTEREPAGEEKAAESATRDARASSMRTIMELLARGRRIPARSPDAGRAVGTR